MPTTLWTNPPFLGWHGVDEVIDGSLTLTQNGDCREADDGVETWLNSEGYLTRAASAAFNPAGDFGGIGWMRWGDEAVGGWHVLASNYTATGNQRAWLAAHVSGANRFYYSINGSTVRNASIAMAVNKSQRVFFAWDYDATTGVGRVSINGKPFVSGTSTGGGALHTSTADFWMGRFPDSINGFNNGGVGPVYLYNRKLTQQEVTDGYNNGFPIQIYQEPCPNWTDNYVVIVDGSSLEWGYAGSYNVNYFDRSTLPWPRALGDYLGPRFIVDNVGGRARTLNNINSTIDYWITNRTCDIAVIGSPINDIQLDDATSETIQGYIDSIKSALDSAGIAAYFINVAPFGEWANYTAGREAVRQTVNAYYVSEGLNVIDAADLLADSGDATLLSADMTSGDGLHWSAKANSLIAQTLGEQIAADFPAASGGSGGYPRSRLVNMGA